MTHVVWDWNGTLFDDIQAVVDATNEVFGPYGTGPMGVDDFRAAYMRPIWVMYENLLGRPLSKEEWRRLDGGFHDSYHRLMDQCGLTTDARPTLQALTAAGHSQSLLSMWQHDRLVPTATRFGIAKAFRRIDGLCDGAPGGSKTPFLLRHLAALGIDPAEVVVIGDSVDDGVAAREAGSRAVLYTGGMTSRRDLDSAGLPVIERLADVAVHL